MAPRGRAAKVNDKNDTLAILNGEKVPDSVPAPSPRKRKRLTTTQADSPAKRRATKNVVEQAQAVPESMSSRLRRPRASTEHKQHINIDKHRRDPFEPPTSPQRSKEKKKTMRRSGKSKPVVDPDNNAFEGEEGEEDAPNPLMRSPAQSTRSHDKRGRGTLQNRDGDEVTVHVHPVQRAQRPQRTLGKRAKFDSNILHGIQSVPGEESITPIPPDALQDLADLPAILARANGGKVNGQVSTRAEQEEAQIPQANGEEPVESIENHSNPDAPDEGAQPSATRQDFQNASAFCNCKKKWNEMLKTAREHRGDKGNIKTTKIQEIIDSIEKLKDNYRRIRAADGADTREIELAVTDGLQNLKDELRRLRAGKDEEENHRLITDIYVQAIPQLVFLLKVMLVTRYSGDSLSITAIEELTLVIDVALKLCSTAFRWQPRPSTLQTRIRRDTGTIIKMSLEALRVAYDRAARKMIAAERKSDIQDWEIAVAEQNAAWLAAEAQKKELARRNADLHKRVRNGERMQKDILDIDDLDLDLPTSRPTGVTRSTPRRGTGVVAARRSLSGRQDVQGELHGRPRLSRERTEDIPGPMARGWSDVEDIALLDGLERFTSADRFMEILKVYGSGDGPLSTRDMDELMQRAVFYKQSMASHFEAEREETGNNGRWAWLLSVDG